MATVWPPHARGHDGRAWVFMPQQAGHGYLGAFQRCPPGAIPRRDPMGGYEQSVVRPRCLPIDPLEFADTLNSQEERAESSRHSSALQEEDGRAARCSQKGSQTWDKCKRATSSVVSTSAPSDIAETTPRKVDTAAEPKQQWSVQQTFRLGIVGEEDSFLGRAKLLDTNVVFSVQTAIDRLNRGTIPCDEESCIVYSASSQAYFLLYRYGSREKAISQLNLSDEVLDTSDSSSHPEQQEEPTRAMPSRSSKPSVATCSPQVDGSHHPSNDKEQATSHAPPQRPAPKAALNHQESDAMLASARDVNRRRRNSPPRATKGDDGQRSRQADRNGQRSKERSGAPRATGASQRSTSKADLFEDGEKLLANAKALLECADRTIKTFSEPSPASLQAKEVKPSEEVQPEESTDDRGSTAGSAGDASLSSRSNGGKGGRTKKGGSSLGTPRASGRKVPTLTPPTKSRTPPASTRTPTTAASETGHADAPALSLPASATVEASQAALQESEQDTNSRVSEKPPTPSEESSTQVVAPSSPVAPKAKDGTGRDITVGNRIFHLLKVIGRGAFGVVWHARERRREELSSSECSDNGSELVAVKAVFANNAKAFTTAVFEAELLQMFSAKLPTSSWDRVPRYISHSVLPRKASASTTNGEVQGGNGGSVRLAMTFVRGCSLDQWLYGISDEEHKQVDVSKLVHGRLPGGRQQSMRLRRACTFVRSLLSQLAEVFVVLQSLAFHRDVSSHNVLIDIEDGEAAQPKYALIDFGLAVKSGSWHQEWCSSNLAGDPRYWTPPSWMAFAFGFRYVETHPNKGFHRQYLTRIDHFGLGILGFEVLFALWNSELAEEDCAKPLLQVRDAWCTFWDAVIRLFQMFHRQGSSAVRQHLARSPDEGVSRVAGHLRLLRQVLRQATTEMADSSLAPLFNLLVDLIDERGVATWAQIPRLLGEDRLSMSQSLSATAEDRLSSSIRRHPESFEEIRDGTQSERGPMPHSPRRFEAVRRDSVTFSTAPLWPNAHTEAFAANAKQVLRNSSMDQLSSTLPHHNRASRFARHRDGSMEPEIRRGSASVAPASASAPPTERDQLDRTMTGVNLAREIQNSELWRYAPPGQATSVVNLSGPPKDELDRSVRMLPKEGTRQQAAPYIRPMMPMDRNAQSYVPPPNFVARGPSYLPGVQPSSSSYVPLPVASRSYVPSPGSVKFSSQPMPQVVHNHQLRASMPTLSPPVPAPLASLLTASSPVGNQMGIGNLQILAGIKPPDRPAVSAGASTASTATTANLGLSPIISGLGTPGGTSTPVNFRGVPVA